MNLPPCSNRGVSDDKGHNLMVTAVSSEPHDGELFSSGVDWVTMTYKAEEYDVFMQAMSCVSALMGQEESKGAESRAAKLRDYDGVRCGAIFAGGRADSYIIEASSDTADYLCKFVIANGCEGRASRIDLQDTILFNQDRYALAIETHAKIREAKQTGAWASQMGLSLYENCGRGDSLFIGSRSSEVYRRLYDKTREQRYQVARWLWRWEVEYKGMRARQVMIHLLVSGNTSTSAQNLVGTEFRKLGLPEKWMFHVKHEELPPLNTPTDDEKRLRWLERQVSPTLRKLRKSGRGDEALDALGA